MSYARHINWYTFEMQVMVVKHMQLKLWEMEKSSNIQYMYNQIKEIIITNINKQVVFDQVLQNTSKTYIVLTATVENF